MNRTIKLYGYDSKRAVEVGDYFLEFSSVLSEMESVMDDSNYSSTKRSEQNVNEINNNNGLYNIKFKKQNDNDISNIIKDKDALYFNIISHKTLTQIVNWVNHYANKPMKKPKKWSKDRFVGFDHLDLLSEGYELADGYFPNLKCSDISEWDSKFLNMPLSDAVSLYKAADVLEIEPLYTICAKKFASQIKNKSVEEMRKFFNVENDLEPDEQKDIQLEYEFAEEF